MKFKEKPRWLKTTYVKAELSNMVVRMVKPFLSYPIYKENTRILISCIDGLGDAFLRLSLVNELVNKYGRENVWVLTKPSALPLYDKLQIQSIKYTDQHRTNVLRRIKLLKKIQRLGVQKAYFLEFTLNENLIELITAPTKVGFSHPDNPENDSRPTILIDNPLYVGTALHNFCQEEDISLSLMDNRTFFPKSELIDSGSDGKKTHVVVAIGAANKSRMMRVDNLCRILEEISSRHESVVFSLIGSGKREKRYVDKITSRYSGCNIKEVILNKPLLDTIDIIKDADVCIGFDSGIYNLAFTLGRPTLCLASDNRRVLHYCDWIRIIQGDGVERGAPDGYGSITTNSIEAKLAAELFSELVILR